MWLQRDKHSTTRYQVQKEDIVTSVVYLFMSLTKKAQDRLKGEALGGTFASPD